MLKMVLSRVESVHSSGVKVHAMRFATIRSCYLSVAVHLCWTVDGCSSTNICPTVPKTLVHISLGNGLMTRIIKTVQIFFCCCCCCCCFRFWSRLQHKVIFKPLVAWYITADTSHINFGRKAFQLLDITPKEFQAFHPSKNADKLYKHLGIL